MQLLAKKVLEKRSTYRFSDIRKYVLESKKVKKEILTQVFSCEYQKMFENSFP